MPPNRARNGRRGHDSKSANQNRSTAGSRDGTPGAGQSKRGGKTAPGVNRSADSGAQNGPATQSALPSQDEHVPLAGFNPDAVDAALKQGFESKAPLFKPEAKPQTTKPESPWGVKGESRQPHSTGNILMDSSGSNDQWQRLLARSTQTSLRIATVWWHQSGGLSCDLDRQGHVLFLAASKARAVFFHASRYPRRWNICNSDNCSVHVQ